LLEAYPLELVQNVIAIKWQQSCISCVENALSRYWVHNGLTVQALSTTPYLTSPLLKDSEVYLTDVAHYHIWWYEWLYKDCTNGVCYLESCFVLFNPKCTRFRELSSISVIFTFNDLVDTSLLMICCLPANHCSTWVARQLQNIKEHNILEQCKGVLLPFQESRAVNRENTHGLVTSPLIQIELKSFPGIVWKYFLVFLNVAFYSTWSVPPCTRMIWALGVFIVVFSLIDHPTGKKFWEKKWKWIPYWAPHSLKITVEIRVGHNSFEEKNKPLKTYQEGLGGWKQPWTPLLKGPSCIEFS
jgi:hypothetical protein